MKDGPAAGDGLDAAVLRDEDGGLRVIELAAGVPLGVDRLEALVDAVASAARDDAIRGVVVSGPGLGEGPPQVERSEADARLGTELALRGAAALDRLETSGIPVACCLTTDALGGGFELSLACHLRTAARGVQLGAWGAGDRVAPRWGGVARLARVVPAGRRVELALAPRGLSAEEALGLGVVSRVAAPEACLGETLELLRAVTSVPAEVVTLVLETLVHGSDLALEDAMHLEATLHGLSRAARVERERGGAS